MGSAQVMKQPVGAVAQKFAALPLSQDVGRHEKRQKECHTADEDTPLGCAKPGALIVEAAPDAKVVGIFREQREPAWGRNVHLGDRLAGGVFGVVPPV